MKLQCCDMQPWHLSYYCFLHGTCRAELQSFLQFHIYIQCLLSVVEVKFNPVHIYVPCNNTHSCITEEAFSCPPVTLLWGCSWTMCHWDFPLFPLWTTCYQQMLDWQPHRNRYSRPPACTSGDSLSVWLLYGTYHFAARPHRLISSCQIALFKHFFWAGVITHLLHIMGIQPKLIQDFSSLFILFIYLSSLGKKSFTP